MAPESNITYREFNESQSELKKEIMIYVEKVDSKVTDLHEKVTHINELVIPLTVAMNQTADNTKDIASSLKEFTRTQSATNGLFNDKMHAHDLAIENMKVVTNSITEKKKYNLGVAVALIGLIATFITGLFQLAPYIFGG